MFAFGETVTILRPGPVIFPTMGDPPSTFISIVVENCAVWPAQTSEVVGAQDTVIWDLELVVPDDTYIAATDQVLFHGETYNVVGRPQFWRSPLTGTKPGTQVQLKSATG